ncbi:MAG: hypothetical protein U0869_24145 [Chloroflexota bacterium]
MPDVARMLARRSSVAVAALVIAVAATGSAAAAVPAWPACGADDGALPVAHPALNPEHFPPPPASFRPSAVTFIGNRIAVIGYGEPLWIGNIDGSGMRCATPVSGSGSLVGHDAVLFSTDGRDWSDLQVRDPDGTVRTIASEIVTARGGPRFAYVRRSTGTAEAPGKDLGVWRVAIDGSGEEKVLPGTNANPWDWLAGSADGRSVATAMDIPPDINGGGPTPPVVARFDGGPVREIRPFMTPLGFDLRGRLIVSRGGAIQAWDPRAGRLINLRLGTNRAVVTPHGRWVTAQPTEPWGIHGRRLIHGIRVRDGLRRTWSLPRGLWEVNATLTTDHFVVVQNVNEPTKLAVIDLVEGWIGFLRFDPRPAGREAPK